jgi:hypothetical protein
MSQKAIREVDAKRILSGYPTASLIFRLTKNTKYVQVTASTDFYKLVHDHKWLSEEKLVAKPDQLVKR